MPSSVLGSGHGSGSESGPRLSGASAEPQPDGGGARRPGQNRRQSRRLLSAVRRGEFKAPSTPLLTASTTPVHIDSVA